jgi:hypothetical protein
VVKQVIAAANRIRNTPYLWGGGHARWWDRGYDCSGSVSSALEAPLVSGSFTTWGASGPGSWITIYANRKHVYAVIAGLRWDTAAISPAPPALAGTVNRHIRRALSSAIPSGTEGHSARAPELTELDDPAPPEADRRRDPCCRGSRIRQSSRAERVRAYDGAGSAHAAVAR